LAQHLCPDDDGRGVRRNDEEDGIECARQNHAGDKEPALAHALGQRRRAGNAYQQ
jgi:hypothetical protein